MMLEELRAVLAVTPEGSAPSDYRDAILQRNVLGKTTESTRQKSLRHLRELYALDEAVLLFGLLRRLHGMSPTSLPLLAIQAAWARDPLLRSTASVVLETPEGKGIHPSTLADALESAFPGQYSELNRNKIARNAASSWTQSGHLIGRTNKVRHHVKPTIAATTMALFLGHLAGYHGAAVFSNPWCHLIDLNPQRARSMGIEAHRAGLLNLRAVGDVVELTFPALAEFQTAQS